MSDGRFFFGLVTLSVCSFMAGYTFCMQSKPPDASRNLVVTTADAGPVSAPDVGWVVVEGRDMIEIPAGSEWLTPDEAMAHACAGEWPARLRHRAAFETMSVSAEACDEWRGARALRMLSGANIDAGVIIGGYEVPR